MNIHEGKGKFIYLISFDLLWDLSLILIVSSLLFKLI